jgi:Mg2+ and Co2+ transporter CorA
MKGRHGVWGKGDVVLMAIAATGLWAQRLMVMLAVAIGMIIYFKRKKWL